MADRAPDADDELLDEADLPDEPAEDDDFLQFWAEHTAGRKIETTTILGLEVEIPRAVSMAFDARLRTLDEANASEDDIAELVAILFGDDTYQAWADAGMSSEQFALVFFWGYANARGRRLSFAEAAVLQRQAEEEQSPRPPANRAERRTAARPRGSATGGPSKRTSRASTGSKRRSSRG